MAQRLIACLAPPFDGKIVKTGLCEMMSDRLRLAVGSDQRLSGAPM